MPYKDSSEYESIARRRKIAQAMSEEAMKPYQTQMVSGRAVPMGWVEGLSKVGQGYFAGKGAKKADVEESQLKKTYGEGKMKAIQDAILKAKGQKQEVGTGRGPLIDIPPDRMGAVADIAGGEYAEEPASSAIQKALLEKELGTGASPYYKPIYDDKGNIYSFDARTANVAPVSVDGANISDPRYAASSRYNIKRAEQLGTGGAELETDPKTAGAVEGAKLGAQLAIKPTIEADIQTAKDKAGRSFGMEGVNKLASRAKEILSGGTGELPTGSTVGAAVDYLGGLVGYSPDGAREAASLKAISGALAGKMPRFEGPQSDYDREYYMDMAARVGDSSVPIDQRLSALEEVVDIWGQYEDTSPAGEGAEPDIDETDSFMRDLDKSLGLGGN